MISKPCLRTCKRHSLPQGNAYSATEDTRRETKEWTSETTCQPIKDRKAEEYHMLPESGEEKSAASQIVGEIDTSVKNILRKDKRGYADD